MNALHDFSSLLVMWPLPVALAIHGAEEWNILGWYHHIFVDLPRKAKTSIRVFVVFVTVLSFVWTVLASIPGRPEVAGYLISPLAAFVLLNGLQHVHWLAAFQQYAPGVASSTSLVVPGIAFLGLVAHRQGLLPAWYQFLLLAVVGLGLAQTVVAGNRLTARFRAISRFGLWLTRLLGL